MSAKRHRLRLGFLPLLDAAVPIVAAARGFAEDEGLELDLVRESSWANIRDRIAIGHFEAAHMLAPMPIAASLGLTPIDAPMVVPMALGLGGNAVTVSIPVWQAIADAGAPGDGDPAKVGAALKAVIAERARRGAAALRLGVVHPFSGHRYELCYWLAACGIEPERDVALTVLPPPLMADALAAGRIDGYCVGEPWNTVAAAEGAGRIVTTKAAIWRSSPEKVLGMRADWAAENRDTVARLLAVLHRASLWCEAPENRGELAALLSEPAYLNLPAARLLLGLNGAVMPAAADAVPDFLIFARKAATFPWVSHALWFFSQMVRWGQAPMSAEALRAARQTYRPDIYRAALGPLGVPLPRVSAKVEGALEREMPVASSSGRLTLGPDGFFDGLAFDPDAVEAYVAALIRR